MLQKYMITMLLMFTSFVCLEKNILSSEKKSIKKNKLRRSRSHSRLNSQIKIDSSDIHIFQGSSIVQRQSPLIKKRWDLTLWKACSESNIETCKLALQNNADPNFFYQKKTSLHIATKKEHFAIIELLLEQGADIHIKRKKGKNALKIAIEKKNDAIVTLFSGYDCPIDCSPRTLEENKSSSSLSPEERTEGKKDKRKCIKYINKSYFFNAMVLVEKYNSHWEKKVLKSRSVETVQRNSYLKYVFKIALDRYASNQGLNKTQRVLEYIKYGVIWHSSREQMSQDLKNIEVIKKDTSYNIARYILTNDYSNAISIPLFQSGFESHPELVLEGLAEIIFFQVKGNNNKISDTCLKWAKKNNPALLRILTVYIKEYCNAETVAAYCNPAILELLADQYYIIAWQYMNQEIMRGHGREKFFTNEDFIRLVARQYCLINVEYDDLAMIESSNKDDLLALITERYAPVIQKCYSPTITKNYNADELITLIAKEPYDPNELF